MDIAQCEMTEGFHPMKKVIHVVTPSYIVDPGLAILPSVSQAYKDGLCSC